MTLTCELEMLASGVAVLAVPLILVERDAVPGGVWLWKIRKDPVGEQRRDIKSTGIDDVLLHFDGTIGVGGWVDRIGLHLAVSGVMPALFRIPLAFIAPFVHV